MITFKSTIKTTMVMLVLMIITAGCGDKKIDSSTDESFKNSIATIKKSLTKKKKIEFEKAIQILAFSEVGNLFAVAANPDGVKRKLKDRLHGKTVDEIIAEAKRISAEREKEDLRAELKKKRIAAEKAKIAPKGAFGIKFGDVYTPPVSKNNVVKLTTGELAYSIGAPLKFRQFKDVTLLLTPKTHKIYAIWSSAKFASRGKVSAEREIVLGFLSRKYKMKPEYSFGNNFDFGISEICLPSNFGKTLEIRYTDTKLAELAKEERLEIESAKSDDSAI